MFPFDLKLTEEKYYTPLPSPVIDRIRPWLDRNVPDYEIVKRADVPDNVPQVFTYRGHTSVVGVAYVYANLNPSDLVAAAERMHRINLDEI